MNVGDLTPIAMVILVAVIAISIGATVLVNLSTVQNTIGASQGYSANTSPAYNITGKGITALGTFSDFFQVIAVVAVAAIVIGLVYMFGRSSNKGM